MAGDGGWSWWRMAGVSNRDVTLPFFFFVFSLLCCNYFQNILSTFFFIFLDENMIIIMTLLSKIFGKRK